MKKWQATNLQFGALRSSLGVPQIEATQAAFLGLGTLHASTDTMQAAQQVTMKGNIMMSPANEGIQDTPLTNSGSPAAGLPQAPSPRGVPMVRAPFDHIVMHA
jgi:hypothetical protein